MFKPQLNLRMNKKIVFTLVCILCCEMMTALRYGRTRRKSLYRFTKMAGEFQESPRTLIPEQHKNETTQTTENKKVILNRAILRDQTTSGFAKAFLQKRSKLRYSGSRFTKLAGESQESQKTEKTAIPEQPTEAAKLDEEQNSREFFERPTKLNGYDIKSHMRKIFRKFTSVSITLETLATTAEYNDVIIVKMTDTLDAKKRNFRANDKYEENIKEKPIVLIVHNLVVMGSNDLPCLSEEKEFTHLVSMYLKHIEDFDIFLIPIANPDGFNHVNQPLVKRLIIKEKLWNKNRSPQRECAGVALDRNFPISWRNPFISSCSQLYPGRKPFSEIETKAMRDLFLTYGHKLLAYFNVHAGSYKSDVMKGDAVLYPKGYAPSPSNEDKYVELKGDVEEALNNASFKVITVTVDTLQHWYGDVHGTSVDYASAVFGIPYTLELVMQTYLTNEDEQEYPVKHNHASLTTVWEKVIRVIFDFMKTSKAKHS